MPLTLLLGDVLLDLGPIEVTRTDLEAQLGRGGRILLIVVISAVVVRLLNRLINRAVDGVRDGRSGPFDRLRDLQHTDTAAVDDEHDEVTDAIARARRLRRAEAMASVGRSVVAVVVWTLTIFVVLGQFDVQLGPYIAGLGIVGAALGFGAQDLVKDFLSGVFMLLEDQYGIGDIVDTGEAAGVVEGISLRTTRVRSVDGTLWYIPNGEIRRLGNMSQGWARALLDIAVAYDTDVDRASAVILDVATTLADEEDFEERFLAEPEVWGVERFGADSVDIRLVIRTTPGDQWAIGRELRRRLKQAFDAEGIEIPFPQRTLWIRDESGKPFPGTAPEEDADATSDAGRGSGDAD